MSRRLLSLEEIFQDNSVRHIDSRGKWSAICDKANQRFKEALAAGDDFQMDFWNAVTRLAEEQITLEESVAAVGSVLGFGGSNGPGCEASNFELQYGMKFSETKGFSAVTDIIIEALKECGVKC